MSKRGRPRLHEGTPLERVLARCEVGDCWRWQGSHTTDGYGNLKVNGKALRVHRIVWSSLVGPIPDEMTVDHLCRVRDCVNPDHLRVVTMQENIKAGYVGRYQREAV